MHRLVWRSRRQAFMHCLSNNASRRSDTLRNFRLPDERIGSLEQGEVNAVPRGGLRFVCTEPWAKVPAPRVELARHPRQVHHALGNQLAYLALALPLPMDADQRRAQDPCENAPAR
ncbi:protein of unknown function (plasmid) [Cupriavidus taiwanensis]|nr:protein of unknown function [Cupriavidus taiwanensis]